MRAALPSAALAAALSGLALTGCSQSSGAESTEVARPGELLPPGVAEHLAERRMNVVWGPEMTGCSVCNAPVAHALARFLHEYPETGVVTALVAQSPFPEDLVVGTKLVVPATDPAGRAAAERPYLAILDGDRRLLGWWRIPGFGRQDDMVYQELVGAYSLTAPLE